MSAFHQDHRYPAYHLDNANLSEHLDHIQALLEFNGYRRTSGEVFLDWPDLGDILVPATEGDVEISVVWQNREGVRPEATVVAMQGESKVGECDGISCAHYTSAEEAQDWLFIISLWVEDDFQGKGLGAQLLLRTIEEMRGVGYRHGSISTDLSNHRAFLFYSNYGFRMVDWTYALTRRLPSPEQPAERLSEAQETGYRAFE